MTGKKKPTVTYFLIILNCLWWLIETAMTGGKSNVAIVGLAFGAQYTPLVMSGHPLELVTSMFVHFGFDHLFGNMIVLYLIGSTLEPMIGHFRYAVIYLSSGLAGNLMTLVFDLNRSGTDSIKIAGGASGAIFGIFGALAATAIIDKKKTGTTLNPMTTFTSLVIIFVNSMGAGVNVLAHLFGALSGFIFGIITRDHDGNGNPDFLQPDREFRLYSEEEYVPGAVEEADRRAESMFEGSDRKSMSAIRRTFIIIAVIVFFITLLGSR